MTEARDQVRPSSRERLAITSDVTLRPVTNRSSSRIHESTSVPSGSTLSTGSEGLTSEREGRYTCGRVDQERPPFDVFENHTRAVLSNRPATFLPGEIGAARAARIGGDRLTVRILV